jgi:hypothetical protein
MDVARPPDSCSCPHTNSFVVVSQNDVFDNAEEKHKGQREKMTKRKQSAKHFISTSQIAMGRQRGGERACGQQMKRRYANSMPKTYVAHCE